MTLIEKLEHIYKDMDIDFKADEYETAIERSSIPPYYKGYLAKCIQEISETYCSNERGYVDEIIKVIKIYDINVDI